MAGHFIGGTMYFPTVSPSSMVLKFRPKFQLPVQRGRCLQGWVTSVENPFNFYVQFVDRRSSEFSDMMKELNIWASTSPVAENLQIGKAYTAMNGDKWFRVLLEKMTPIGLAVILFVDTGLRDVVEISKLHQLDSKFMATPAQAVLCQLANLIAPEPWPARSTIHFKELVENHFVDVFANQTYLGDVGRIYKNETKLQVILYVDDDECSINSKVVEFGSCTVVGTLEEPWHMDSRMPVRLTHFHSIPTNCDQSIGPQNLVLGGKVLTALPEVTVSHVVDPGKFYVQHRSEDSQKLHCSLINKLAPDLPKAREISIGEMYAIQDFKTKQWFRGKCVHKSGRTAISKQLIYDFFLIDEGSTLKAAELSVRQINDELKKFSPMIYECSLNVERPPTGWSADIISQFKTMILQQKLRMTLFSTKNGVRFVDLQPVDADGTVTESVASMIREAIEKQASRLVPKEFVTRVAHIKKGVPLTGRVAVVNDPDDFYIRFDDSEAFWSFNTLLQKEYNQCHTWKTFKVVTIQKGFPFVLRHEGQWFRVLVEEPLGLDEVSVYFVDTGLRLTANANQLLPIQDRFMEFPVITLRCKLFGVCSKHPAGLWSEEGKDAFRSIIKDAEVTVFVEGTVPTDLGSVPGKDSPLLVVVYCGDDSRSANMHFTCAGHGISVRKHDLPSHNRKPRLSIGSSSSEPSSPVHSLASVSTEFTDRFPARKISTAESCFSESSLTTFVTASSFGEDPSSRAQAISSVDVLLSGSKSEGTSSNASSIRTPANVALAQEVAALECPTGIKGLDESARMDGKRPPEGSYIIAAKFLMCQSHEAIYFRPLPYEVRYHEMMSDMQRVYRSSKIEAVTTFDVGSRCAAFVYGHWIRITIQGIDANLRCHTIDMDNGQPHQLAPREIFPLLEPFDAVPKLALRCSLMGLKNPSRNIVSEITSALLPADEIYLCAPRRPKAIPPILSVNVIYTVADSTGKSFINLNSV